MDHCGKRPSHTPHVTCALGTVFFLLKPGVCPATASLAPLVFAAQAMMWDSPSEDSLEEADQSPSVVSYSDFTLMWERNRPIQIKAFERLLLVACKGEERIEILTASKTS